MRLSEEASECASCKHRIFFSKFKGVWGGFIAELRHRTNSLAAVVRSTHGEMLEELRSAEVPLLVACQQFGTETLTKCLDHAGGIRSIMFEIDQLRATTQELFLHSEEAPSAILHVSPTVEEVTVALRTRVEHLRSLNNDLLQPIVAMKSSLQRHNYWDDACEHATPGESLKKAMVRLLHDAVSAREEAEMFRMSPNVAVSSLPHLRVPLQQPSVEHWMGPSPGKGGMRRKAAQAIRAERVLGLPQMELVVSNGKTVVVESEGLRGHEREHALRMKTVHSRFDKSMDLLVDPLKQLRLEDARLVRHRAKTSTDNITAFLNVVNHEVAMFGPLGEKKRREEEIIAKYKLSSLRPTTKNSAATLNCSAPYACEAGDEEPPVGKLLKRKLAQSRAFVSDST